MNLDQKEDRILVAVNMERDDVFGTYAIRRKGTALPSSAHAFWEYLLRL